MDLKCLRFLVFSVLIADCLCGPDDFDDISNQTCGVYGPTPSFDAPNITILSHTKTLNIIFDTTGSMRDDIDSLRSAAKEIVEKLRSSPVNPISDYVLSLLNDPGSSLFQTTDPDKFLSRLDMIIPNGDGDCSEVALEGIINALQVSKPYSYAYVFTDADALDYERVDEVIELSQKKQITVSFLTTGTCFDLDAPGRLVIDQIALYSGGVVYDITRDEVDNILLAISEELDIDFVIIDAFKYKLMRYDETVTSVNIDASFTSVTITINGRRSIIRVTLSNGLSVNVTTIFENESMKIIRFPTTGGNYNITTFAESFYSLRISGISSIKFKFGFSPGMPFNIAETTVEPEWNYKNHLTVFYLDPKSFIKCLLKVTIIPIKTIPRPFEYLSEEFDNKINHLFYDTWILYTTVRFTMPRGGFKIRVSGYDKFGNYFERLIPTGLIERECEFDVLIQKQFT